MENELSKKSFFTALEHLDDLASSSQEEEDPLERLVARSKPFHIQNRTASLEPAPPQTVPLLRANSDPQPSSAETNSDIIIQEVSSKRCAGLDELKGRTLQRSQTTGTMPGPPPSKKRRVNNMKMVPEEQQIFKELVFCE